MIVHVNGEPRELASGCTVHDVAGDPRGRAVAVNGAVVRAADWPTTTLHEADRVEVVTAHQGG